MKSWKLWSGCLSLLAILSMAPKEVKADSIIPSICDAVPNNIVQNCGFEISLGSVYDDNNQTVTGGAFTDWQSSPITTPLPGQGHLGEGGGVYDFFVDHWFPGQPFSNSGDNWALFGNTTPDQIQQTLTTNAVDDYSFSFYLAQEAVNAGGDFQVYWDGSLVFSSPSSIAPTGNTQFSFTELAAGNDTITFIGQSPDGRGYFNLDDVVVTDLGPAAPEPDCTALCAVGMLALIYRQRRVGLS